MAAFATLQAAEIRCIAQTKDGGPWVEAFPCYNKAGVITARILRRMPPIGTLPADPTFVAFDDLTGSGDWDEVYDDTTD